MKFDRKDPPREFTVGEHGDIIIKDQGNLHLTADEQVTFVTESGAEYDFARKDWGYYASPSLNGRLEGFNLRTALTRNPATGRYFILVVERGHEDSFQRYLDVEKLDIVTWVDDTASLDRLRAAVESAE